MALMTQSRGTVVIGIGAVVVSWAGVNVSLLHYRAGPLTAVFVIVRAAF